MNYKDLQFDNKMSKKISPPKFEGDTSIQGRRIEARTFPFALPLKTTAQRDSIIKPQQGLIIFNTTTNTIDYYNGVAWKQLLGT